MTPQLILGIDPGPTTSGVVLYDPARGIVLEADAKMISARIMQMLRGNCFQFDGSRVYPMDDNLHLAMETIVSYGARIGMETIANIELIGRIKEAWSDRDDDTTYLSRPDILGHLTGRRNAKEADCADRLKEMHGGLGAVGTKKAPGPLYGVTSHAWSALAVAVVAAQRIEKGIAP